MAGVSGLDRAGCRLVLEPTSEEPSMRHDHVVGAVVDGDVDGRASRLEEDEPRVVTAGDVERDPVEGDVSRRRNRRVSIASSDAVALEDRSMGS
jgi:hypothetical protein